MRKLLQVLSLVTIMLGTTLSATPLSAADAAVDKNRKQARRNAASTTIATELETSSAPQVIIPMSDSAQRVVTYLAGVGGANWCYAGTIASNTGVPKNSVAAVLTGLLAKGWAEEVETEETFMNPNTKRVEARRKYRLAPEHRDGLASAAAAMQKPTRTRRGVIRRSRRQPLPQA